MTSDDPIAVVEDVLVNDQRCVASLRTATESLATVSRAASDAGQASAARCAATLAGLVELLTLMNERNASESGDQHPEFYDDAAAACGLERACEQGVAALAFDDAEVIEFILGNTDTLRGALDEKPDEAQQVHELTTAANERWGDALDALGVATSEHSLEDWPGSDDYGQAEAVDLDSPSHAEVAELLSALGASTADAVVPDVPNVPGAPDHDESKAPIEPSFEANVILESASFEPELLEAYLDDATRCLGSLEAAVLVLEQNPDDRQSLLQICRELHTIKGASASVGLNELANYLHNLEESVQASHDGSASTIDAQEILAGVDTIRAQIAKLSPSAESGNSGNESATPAAGRSADFDAAGDAAEDTIRVKSSQLDRLMDMFAELVMIRNRRESRVDELQQLNEELVQCASRIRVEGDNVGRTSVGDGARLPLREIGSDILEIARTQREACDRVSEENIAISGFIRSFRHELTELQRLPVEGLFRRLQRSVRDAAHREGKRVRLELRGEHAGLEHALQERLFEPLLHIVRNAVSHGIESEQMRVAAGKEGVGTIVLEARGGFNLLVLEVRDDGKGLDYDAIRRRGVERGLITADQPTTREELAQLIFHPGFSTKDATSAVSGRGIGMDVVAETLNRMQSWAEVESNPGFGTTIRLSIPLRSVIEHAMVFSSGGQLFAIPMQYVHSAGEMTGSTKLSPNAASLPSVHVCELFGVDRQEDHARAKRLVIGYSKHAISNGESSSNEATGSHGRRFEMLVDEIVGPEEVVIRPLPPLLRHQDLFSGISLSGKGELVLLLDSRRLVELGASSARSTDDHVERPASESSETPNRHVLVVDDSISSRRHIARLLRTHGHPIVEAADGMEALELLRSRTFAAVFSDLEMPRVGGLELLREVSTLEQVRKTPVVIVSSRGEGEFQEEALRLGAAAYLIKPAKEINVAETLRRLSLAGSSRI